MASARANVPGAASNLRPRDTPAQRSARESDVTERVRPKALQRVLLVGLSLLSAAGATRADALSYGGSATLITANCAPVAASSEGTMVWYARNGAGVWDAYIGNASCQGAPLLAPYKGNRGPAGITANGRYVLLTTAEGWDRTLPDSSPGQGSGNSIQLYDRQTGRLSTLLAGATPSQRGVIWPSFNASGTKIVWSQMIKTAAEAPPNGQWALHVADVNLEAGTLSDNVEWQNPDGQPAFYEAYGWVPGTNRVIFMSNTDGTSSAFRNAQLFTLPEELSASTPPTRISPEFAPAWPWQSPVNVFHEFAHFAPTLPNTLYTSIGADTVGGDDLYSYDLRSQQPSGLLGQPSRITYFGGSLNLNVGSAPVPGWPSPSYTVVTTMAWVNGAWVATTCPDMLCSKVSAWRIDPFPAEAQAESQPVGGQQPAPGGGGKPAPAPPPSPRPGKRVKHACASVPKTRAGKHVKRRHAKVSAQCATTHAQAAKASTARRRPVKGRHRHAH
jgi:hypothetical protein